MRLSRAESPKILPVSRIARLAGRLFAVVVVAATVLVGPNPVTLAQGRFLYTDDGKAGPNTIGGFSVDERGVLRRLPGSPFLSGGLGNGFTYSHASSVVVSRVRRLLLVASSGGLELTVFRLNPTTGIPSSVSEPAVALAPVQPDLTNHLKVAVTPDGRYAIACVWSDDLHALETFRIDPDGRLQAVEDSRVVGPGTVAGFSVAPDGRRIVVASPELGTISLYRLDASGRVSESSNVAYVAPDGLEPVVTQFTCGSDRMFVSFRDGMRGNIGVFDITSDDRLVPSPGVPVPIGTGSWANELLLTRDERYLYASFQFSNELLGFAVAPGGGLTGVVGSPYRIDGFLDALGLATDDAGRYLFLANGDAQVSVYSILDDGRLAVVAGSPFVTSSVLSNVGAIATYPGKLCPGSPTLYLAPPDDVVADGTTVSEGRPGAFVSYTSPGVESSCAPASMSCTPPSGSFFAAGSTSVQCTAVDSCGNEGRCQFNVTVKSPFAGNAVCLIDDATGDRFSFVNRSDHVLFGYWFYVHQETGRHIAGRAGVVEDRPGTSLVARDSGRNPPNTDFRMKATIRFDIGTAVVRLRDRATNERITLRVDTLSGQPACE